MLCVFVPHTTCHMSRTRLKMTIFSVVFGMKLYDDGTFDTHAMAMGTLL